MIQHTARGELIDRLSVLGLVRSLHTYHDLGRWLRHPDGRKGAMVCSFNIRCFIQGLNLAKDTCGILPAQVAFGSASALLILADPIRWPIIRIMAALRRLAPMYAKNSTGGWLKERQPDDLNQFVLDAIGGSDYS